MRDISSSKPESPMAKIRLNIFDACIHRLNEVGPMAENSPGRRGAIMACHQWKYDFSS